MTHYRAPIVQEPIRKPSWPRRWWWALRREWDRGCVFNGVQYTVGRDLIVWRENFTRDRHGFQQHVCNAVYWWEVPPHWRYLLWPNGNYPQCQSRPDKVPPHWPYPDDDEFPPGAG